MPLPSPLRRVFAILGRVLLGILALVLLAAGAAGWLLHRRLATSLPLLDGTAGVAGLRGAATLERDERGSLTVRSGHALDEARALGFFHGQERFFQMDLLRRSAAGEVAALIGGAALPLDRDRRRHRLRRVAEAALGLAEPAERALLEAYAEGVNAGLSSLGSPPFEYLLLRTSPEPWRAEDCLLVVGAIYFDMQGGEAKAHRDEWVFRRHVSATLADFLHPKSTAWDSPIVGDPAGVAAVPGPEHWDWREAVPTVARSGRGAGSSGVPGGDDGFVAGSNQWAVAGRHAASGLPIVANDMHLGLGVPGIWHHAALVRGGRRVAGVVLPGVPVVVAGSNGDVAWSLTNSPGNPYELIALERDPGDPGRFVGPAGTFAVEHVEERIEVAHGKPEVLRVGTTPWGPVMDRLPDGTPLALRWVAHDPEGLRPAYLHLGEATTVRELFALARRSGVPILNVVAGDRHGTIGWSILGRLPRRSRPAELVTPSSLGSSWEGWLAPGDYPEVIDPEDGFLWTANSRVVDGEALAAIGDAGYDLGARTAQIRRRLGEWPVASEADHLAIQLDDEALFLAPWRDRLLGTLDAGAVGNDPRRLAAREALEGWGGRASTGSVGYRLARGWRRAVIAAFTAELRARMRRHDADWDLRDPRAEAWAWPILAGEPEHLLPPGHASWREFRLAMLDQVLDDLGVEDAGDLAARTWGEFNTVALRHPLSRAIPLLGHLTDLPARQLPGDSHLPRVQGRAFGASQRSVVSPGGEERGILHLPGGPSGHPRSPFHGAGQAAWEDGEPTPFLPGPARHVLELRPGS